MTYTTTAAAHLADVTTATIRVWCRMGAVKATKVARRWVIDATSLAHRISLGTRRTTKRETTTVDLTTTYTYTPVGGRGPVTITPKIKTRTSADGDQLTSIRHIIPLLADRIDAITDEGDRLHTLEVLSGASIVLCPTPRDIDGGLVTTRDEGRIATTYAGTRHISIDDVLDLGEQIRTHLDTE